MIEARLDGVRASDYADLTQLRDARQLARRFIGGQTTCAAKPPVWARGACSVLRRFISLKEPWPEKSERPAWWEQLRQAEKLHALNRLAEAAEYTREAYILCDRKYTQEPHRCMSLVHETLELRRVAGSRDASHQDRRTREDSLALLDRVFAAARVSCKRTTELSIVDALCEHRVALLTRRAEAFLDQELYSEAADTYELAYATCKDLGEPLECWLSFGRSAWRARQRVLHTVQHEESMQFNRARGLLAGFVHNDMGKTCNDAGLPDPVRRVCTDLRTLNLAALAAVRTVPDRQAREDRLPTFVAAFIAPGSLAETFSACMSQTLTPAACWPEVRARTFDLSQRIRDLPAEGRAPELANLQRDLGAYLRAADMDCEQLGAPPQVCTQAQQISQRLAVASRPAPTLSQAPYTQRRMAIGGAVSLALGGATLAMMGVGMYWGYQATETAREIRDKDPQRPAKSLQDGSVFRSGEAANQLVVAAAIVGCAAIVTGIVLMSVDAKRRRKLRERVSLRRGGLTLAF